MTEVSEVLHTPRLVVTVATARDDQRNSPAVTEQIRAFVRVAAPAKVDDGLREIAQRLGLFVQTFTHDNQRHVVMHALHFDPDALLSAYRQAYL